MATYAILKDDIVINLHEWDGDLELWSPPVGQTCIPAGNARIGDTWNGTVFTTPTPPEPVKSDFEQLADLLRSKNLITAQERNDLRLTRSR